MQYYASSIIMNICIVALLTLNLIMSVYSLECYVCKDQDSNHDKCVKTVKQCDSEEKMCLTEVRWGSTPYWAPSGEKQYYISKACATNVTCANKIKQHSPRCNRIWYNDWECAECCLGDRCNYFVTLSSGSIQPSTLISFCLLLLTQIKRIL